MICPFDVIVLMYIILFMLSRQANRYFCNRFQSHLFLSLSELYHNWYAVFRLLHRRQKNYANGCELPSHSVCFPCYPEQGCLDKTCINIRK